MYSDKGDSPALNTMGGGNRQPFVKLTKVGELKITAKKRVYDTPKEINQFLKDNKKGMTISQIAEAIKLPKTQIEHYFRTDKSRAMPNPEIWMKLKGLLKFDDTYDEEVTSIYEKEVEFESSRRVYSSDGIAKTLDSSDSGIYQIAAERGRYNEDGEIEQQLEIREDGVSNTLTGVEKDNRVVVHNLHPRTGDPEKGGTGHLTKDDGTAYCHDAHNSQAVEVIEDFYPDRIRTFQESPTLRSDRSGLKVSNNTQIRRLTPTECERLQGFPDGWTEGQSDTQRYKQLGNAVSVPVVKAVGERLIDQL